MDGRIIDFFLENARISGGQLANGDPPGIMPLGDRHVLEK
jgi:hypothetical protein